MLKKAISSLPAAYLLLVLAQSMIGVNIVGSKFLTATLPLLFLLSVRFIAATLFLFTMHKTMEYNEGSTRSHIQSLNKSDWFFIIAQALTSGVLFNCFMVFGLRYTDAGVAGIITSALPALIAVLAWVFLKEKFTGKKGICVGFATLGLLFISANNVLGAELDHSFFGDFMIFIALFPEAMYYILAKLYSPKLPLFLFSAILNGINAIVVIPLMFFWVDLSALSVSLSHWAIMITIGLGSGLFFVFWCLGSDKTDNILASLTTAVVPIATFIIAWFTLGETINSIQLFGMSMVIASIAAYAFSLKTHKFPPKVEDDLSKETV